MPQNANRVRVLSSNDVSLIERLLRQSEYIYQRFTPEELLTILTHYPAVGMFHNDTLYSFLLSQSVNASVAWIGGFGVSWTESRNYLTILSTLLDQLAQQLVARQVRSLYYSGNDTNNDWLRPVLLKRGFIPYRFLYAYDKFDYGIPSAGNQEVIVRPVQMDGIHNDMAALLAIEHACFEDLWRYDALGFNVIAATHPYFVVAEVKGRVIGYQFNAIDGNFGYLVRIAVHPSYSGQGIGVRLMADAIHFFQRARVSRIMLNTQEENTHAHRLYEWFDFVRIQQIGFVLQKTL